MGLFDKFKKMEKSKKPKVTRAKYIGRPLLIPAMVLLILSIDERTFRLISEKMANMVMIALVFSIIPLVLWGEEHYQKKVVSILDDENNSDEYKRTINNPEESPYGYGRRYDTEIFTAYLMLYQKDYDKAYWLATKEPPYHASRFIRELREKILTEARANRNGIEE